MNLIQGRYRYYLSKFQYRYLSLSYFPDHSLNLVQIIYYNYTIRQKIMIEKEDNKTLGEPEPIIIGYYALRGKAQMPRLLCQYLHLPYRDLLFTSKTWEDFKNIQNLNLTFNQLPFLQDGQMSATETYPMCQYILHKANRKDLLGSSLIEEIKTDSIIWQTQPTSYICTTYLNNRDLTPQVKADACNKLWARVEKDKLNKLQKEASGSGYYFKNLSLVDFYLYESFYFLRVVSPDQLNVYPKLTQIVNNFSKIPEIAQYQKSKRCVKQICPVKFNINWREICSERKSNG